MAGDPRDSSQTGDQFGQGYSQETPLHSILLSSIGERLAAAVAAGKKDEFRRQVAMSAISHQLRVGQWIYADSLGRSEGVMGRIICLPRTKAQQVVVLESADDDPIVVEPHEIEFVADTQEQLHEQLWQLRFTTA